jgi:hypothetical protein
MMAALGNAIWPLCIALVLAVTAGRAETAKPSARDSAAVQSCIKSAGGAPQKQERCTR